MIPEILAAAGIKERGSRFAKPPDGIYAVLFDDTDKDGPDSLPPVAYKYGAPPAVIKHIVSLEVYEPKKDDAALAALEAQLDARGIIYTKQDRLWIQSEQMYQTIYELSYIEKRRT
jgi:hypothetical protein